MSAGVQLQPGWILHRRPFRDTSEIHDVFTRDYGRVGLVSRGSRRARRRASVAARARPEAPP